MRSAMRTTDLIAKKRDGKPLGGHEIRFLVRGYVGGEVADYQMAALLMAIYIRGMTTDETLSLTKEMIASGAVVDFSDLGGVCVDKHSTGGVGDKTSLVLAPVAAAAGVKLPMISGRALAHSGGTLDKLESMPGFRTDLSLDEFRGTLIKVGAALIGQTVEIAPADKKLYALRDVTATVACRPLMAASIMSKKIAEGIDGLVLDVKHGSGAFLKTPDEARALAELMIDIGQGMKKRCVALITDMNQPLGRAVGNSLEVIEAFETLRGRGPADLSFLCRELAAHMMVLGQVTEDLDQGRETYERLIESGKALEKMEEIIEAQGGDRRVLDDYGLLPGARHQHPIRSSVEGYVTEIDTEAVGWAAMLLGAGRTRLDSSIDHGVGVTIEAKLGHRVEAGSPLATLHYNDGSDVESAVARIEAAYVVASERVTPPQLVHDILR